MYGDGTAENSFCADWATLTTLSSGPDSPSGDTIVVDDALSYPVKLNDGSQGVAVHIRPLPSRMPGMPEEKTVKPPDR